MAGLDIIEDDIIKKIPNIVTSSYKGIFYLESVTTVIYITHPSTVQSHHGFIRNKNEC
jgi:hypothetical protein